MLNYLSPAEAVRLVKSGDTIVVQGSTSIPMVLLRALTERASELRDVKVISGFGVHPEEAPYAKRELMDSFRALNIFVPNNLRRAMREGVADTIPCFLGTKILSARNESINSRLAYGASSGCTPKPEMIFTSRNSLARSVSACKSTIGMEVEPCTTIVSPDFTRRTASAGDKYCIKILFIEIISIEQC